MAAAAHDIEDDLPLATTNVLTRTTFSYLGGVKGAIAHTLYFSGWSDHVAFRAEFDSPLAPHTIGKKNLEASIDAFVFKAWSDKPEDSSGGRVLVTTDPFP